MTTQREADGAGSCASSDWHTYVSDERLEELRADVRTARGVNGTSAVETGEGIEAIERGLMAFDELDDALHQPEAAAISAVLNADLRNLPDSSGGCPSKVLEALERLTSFPRLVPLPFDTSMYLADLATIESHIASTQEEAERWQEEARRYCEDADSWRKKATTLESRIAELERVGHGAQDRYIFDHFNNRHPDEMAEVLDAFAALSTASKDNDKGEETRQEPFKQQYPMTVEEAFND